MIERFRTYFETLERLSTDDLDRSVEKLVREEKRNTALVIAHIAEMSRRKGALERGYRNLFDYCTRRLNLSEGSVALRIQVANVSRRFPQILAVLAENRISLTVAGMLAPHLTEENVEKLLSECAGMTKRELAEYLVRLSPMPVFAPSIRKTPSSAEVRLPAPSLPVAPISEAPAGLPAPLSASPRPSQVPSPSILKPATPMQFNFRFSASREFRDKFERLAEVLGVENPLPHMARILERALDIALDKKDPKRRLERRMKRRRKEPRLDEISHGRYAVSRYVAPGVQERVHARASYQCEFQGPDGTRCRSRTGLQVEHVKPFAIFRSHDERFLKALCPKHNRFTAERVYGVEFMNAKIAASRQRGEVSKTFLHDTDPMP
jgi:hypothetical protein